MSKNDRYSPLHQKLSRRSFLRSLGGFIAGHWLSAALPVSIGGTLAWAERDTLDLKLEHWDLFYPALPSALDGKTVVQLSDLHLKSLQIKPYTITNAVARLQPDLLVLTGDILSERTDLDKVESYLKPLSSPNGSFVVLGNNDYSHFSQTLLKRFIQLLTNLGWKVLQNKAEYLPALHLWVIGVDDPATAHDDVSKAYAALSQAAGALYLGSPPFRLVLAHSTDCLDDVAAMGADLLLTGHTHGGQIRLPGLNPLITNTYLGDEGIYEGYHVIQGVPLYINRGLGESVLPIRFNVPPEIAAFTLHRGQQAAQHRTLV